MTNSEKLDEAERLFDREEIAEALRSGTLDTQTRFAERRSERDSEEMGRSGGRPPQDILADLRKDDTETSSDSSDSGFVRVELSIRVVRDGSNLLSNVRDVLAQAIGPEIPSSAIMVQQIDSVQPSPDHIYLRAIVRIEAKYVVEAYLSENISKLSQDATVKLLP